MKGRVHLPYYFRRQPREITPAHWPPSTADKKFLHGMSEAIIVVESTVIPHSTAIKSVENMVALPHNKAMNITKNLREILLFTMYLILIRHHTASVCLARHRDGTPGAGGRHFDPHWQVARYLMFRLSIQAFKTLRATPVAQVGHTDISQEIHPTKPIYSQEIPTPRSPLISL